MEMATITVRAHHTLRGVEMAVPFLAKHVERVVVVFGGNALPEPIMTIERRGNALIPIVNPTYRKWVEVNGCDPRFICRCV
jgi:hypothetical protein